MKLLKKYPRKLHCMDSQLKVMVESERDREKRLCLLLFFHIFNVFFSFIDLLPCCYWSKRKQIFWHILQIKFHDPENKINCTVRLRHVQALWSHRWAHTQNRFCPEVMVKNSIDIYVKLISGSHSASCWPVEQKPTCFTCPPK